MSWRKVAVVVAAVGATATTAGAAFVVALRGVDRHPADRIGSYDVSDILERANHSPAPPEPSPVAPASDRPHDLGHTGDDHPGDTDDD